MSVPLLTFALGVLALGLMVLAEDREGVRPPPLPGNPPAGVLRFTRLHVNDEMMGQEAFTMLIPAGWRAKGGVVWWRNPMKPATAVMQVVSPDGRQQFEVLPQMPFVDGAREAAVASARMAGAGAMAMMAERFAEGKLCYGNEIRRVENDPAKFVRKFVLPHYRDKLAGLRIVKEEEMEEVARAMLAADPAEAGTRKTIRAGRTRIEFTDARQAFEEDIYCVLVLVEIPAIHQTYWGAEHLLAFRAPVGQLDAQAKVLRTICNSFRIDPRWFNKYVQVVASLIQGQIREIQAVGEFSRRWAQMSNQMSTDRQKAWEDRQSRYDEMNRKYSQHQRGVEDYKDADGNRVELPSGYGHAWRGRGEEYIVTENPNFNPNVELNGDWTPLERVP